MLKFAIVAGADKPHGSTFTGIFNGTVNPETGEVTKPPHPKVAGATITRIWDPDRAAAEELARARNIETVCADLEEAAEGVDAVIIADDCTQEHAQYADPFIERGIPLFVDKPLRRKYTEAKAIIERVQEKGLLFQSGSSLRYCNEVLALNADLSETVGELKMAATFGPNELIFYGIHSLELLLGVIPGRVATVQHLGTETLDLVCLKFESGVIASWMCGEDAKGSFHMVVRGDKGQHVITGVTDFYENMLANFVNMVRTGEPPLSLEDTLHVIAILDAAQRSCETGGGELEVPE